MSVALRSRQSATTLKELPPAERAQVAKFIVEHEDSWIPDEFKAAMQDAGQGRWIEMETALQKTPDS